MRWFVAGAAAAALTVSVAVSAHATVCTSACDHNYSVCNQINGASAQQTCMPKWFQCKKACQAPTQGAPKGGAAAAPKR